MPGEPLVQPLRERLGREGGHVDPFQHRVVLADHIQVGRGLADRQWPLVRAGGEAVRVRRVVSEPGQHVRAGQRGELGQGVDAEPPQQVGEFGTVQCGDAHPGEKSGGGVGWHDSPGPRGQHGGEHPVRHPGLDLHAAPQRDVLDQPLRCLGLTAVVAGRTTCRKRAGARPHHLHPWREFLHRRHHRFERPRVPARVVGHHHQVGIPALRFALAQPTPDALGPRRRRTGQHPVGVQHRHRRVHVHALGQAGRDHRPVGTPHQ